MREIVRQLVSEATQALEIAAQNGEQPPQWVRAFMSPAGWQHYRHLREEVGPPWPSDHGEPEAETAHRGVAGCSMDTILELEVLHDYGQAKKWAALVIDGEEIVPAGCPNWLRFVWLSQRSDQQAACTSVSGGSQLS